MGFVASFQLRDFWLYSSKIKGKWASCYRAVDKEGHTIDFLLTPTRDRDAAEAFLHKAIHTQGLPEKVTIDQSGANTAALERYKQTHKTTMASATANISTLWNRITEE